MHDYMRVVVIYINQNIILVQSPTSESIWTGLFGWGKKHSGNFHMLSYRIITITALNPTDDWLHCSLERLNDHENSMLVCMHESR